MWWDQSAVELTYNVTQILGALIIGYLLGSIPFGL